MHIIISDSTTLIILAKTDRLYLLSNLFEKVYIPQAVFDEINCKQDKVSQRLHDAKFIELNQVTNQNLLSEIANYNIDKGESEAITLALELHEKLLIDERKGRIVAKEKGVFIIGLLGILRENYQSNLISYDELIEILDDFKAKKLRLSQALERVFLDSL